MSFPELVGTKEETPKSLFQVPHDYIDTDKEENYNFNYFIEQSDLTKYKHYHFITSTHNTYHTALLYEIAEEGKLFFLILKNIYDLKGENISYKRHRSIKLDRNYIDAFSGEEKPFNEMDSQEKKPKMKKRRIHLACDTFLLLEIEKKKIVLIDFEEKKYTTLFTSSFIMKTIHIVYTYDELLSIDKEVVKPKPEEKIKTKVNAKEPINNLVTTNKSDSREEREYLTRTYVFCISEGQLYFFLLNKYVLYHLKFVLYLFPLEELKVNIEQILIQKFQNAHNDSKWYYLIVVLQEGKMTRYITEYTSKCFKNFLLEFREMFNKGIIRKVSTTIDKATFTQVKLIIFENQQSYIMLQIDKQVYLIPFLLHHTPTELKEKFLITSNKANTNNFQTHLSLIADTNNNSVTPLREEEESSKYSERMSIKDKGHLFSEEKDVIVYRLPCQTDFNKVIITITAKNLCCFIHNTLYIYHRSNENERNPNKNLFIHSFKDSVFLYGFIQYPLFNYSMLLTSTCIMKLRYNDNLHLFLTKVIKPNKSIVNERDNVYYCLHNTLSNAISKESSVLKCKVCSSSPKELIPCKQCNSVRYCSINHLTTDHSNYHFFECELIQLMTKVEEKQGESNQIIINDFIIAIDRILKHIFDFIHSSIDYHFYIIYLQFIIQLMKIAKVEFHISSMLEMKFNKTNHMKIGDRIFNMELMFAYDFIQILLINFAIKAKLNELSHQLFNSSRLIFLLNKKQDGNKTIFNSFGFPNDCASINLGNSNEDNSLVSYCRQFFFKIDKYINHRTNHLCIFDRFVSYYLYSNASLLKIALYFNSERKEERINTELLLSQIAQTLSNIASLFEEKYSNQIESNAIINNNDMNSAKKSQFMLSYVYFNLCFSVIRIGKTLTGIKMLKDISHLLEVKEGSGVNSFNNQFKGIINYNLGLLNTFIGNYDLGIHYFEESLKISFESIVSSKYTMKMYYSLILAYININKPETAFCLIKEALELSKKSNYFQQSKLLKLKIYMIYILDLTGFQYNSLQIAEKKKDKQLLPKQRSRFEAQSELLNYILEEKSEKTLEEISGKYDQMFLRVLEFFARLSPRLLYKLNEDNKLIKASSNVRDENIINHDRSMIVNSKDTSLNVSSNLINLNREIQSFKDEESFNYEEEIEIKLNVYDELDPNQKKELSNLDNKLFLRSNILRDPKGAIEMFNLNFHPTYTYDFFLFLNKLSENYLLKKINSYGIINNLDRRFFDYKRGNYLKGLSNFCSMDRVKNIIAHEHAKLDESLHDFETPMKRPESLTQECNEWINGINTKLMKKQINIGYLDNAFREMFYLLSEQEREYLFNNPEKVFNFIYADIHHKVIDANNREDSQNESIGINEDNEQKIPSSILTSFEIGLPRRSSALLLNKTAEKEKNIVNSIKGTVIDENSNKISASEEFSPAEKQEIMPSKRRQSPNTSDTSSSKRLSNIREEPIKFESEKNEENIKKRQSSGEEKSSSAGRYSKFYNKKIDIDYSQIVSKENNSPFISENFTEESPKVIQQTKTTKEDKKRKLDTKDEFIKPNEPATRKSDLEFLEEIIQKEKDKGKPTKQEIIPIEIIEIKPIILDNIKPLPNKPKQHIRHKSVPKIPLAYARDIATDGHSSLISLLLRKEEVDKKKEETKLKDKTNENDTSMNRVKETITIVNNLNSTSMNRTRNVHPVINNELSLKHTVQLRQPPTYQQMKERILRRSLLQEKG